MTGKVLILHDTGWACSLESKVNHEVVITDTPKDGFIPGKRVTTMLVDGLFNAIGKLANDSEVNIVQKIDGTIKKVHYRGRVEAISNERGVARINLLTVAGEDKVKETILKIKQIGGQ